MENNNLSYSKVIFLCKEEKLVEVTKNSLFFEKRDFSYKIIFTETDDTIILFIKEIDLIIIDGNNKCYKKTIICNLDIMKYLEELKINIKYVIINNDNSLKLEELINLIYLYVKDNKILLYELKLEIPKIEGKLIGFKDDDINPEKYSDYFFDYFEYENKNKGNIIYQENEIRTKIKRNLEFLYEKIKLKEYKITGPSSIGKSMTLFFFSRHHYNVIYINLKVLRKNDKDKSIKIIISELGHLSVKKETYDDINEKIKNLEKRNSILQILLNIIEIILKIHKSSIMLILDQYKEKNYESYPNFNNELKSLMEKYKTLKLVYCSSINDNNLRDKVLESFIKFNGLIEDYNETTQKYYFYYANIYALPEHKNKNTINYIFDNRKKYISLFKSIANPIKDIYNSIISKMDKKIKEFNISFLKNKENEKYSEIDLFIHIKKLLNNKYNIKYIYHILRFCPLKYIKVIFNKDTFTIKPIFPFIHYYINSKINKKEAFDYFKSKKYNYFSFLSNRVKGEYFEYCSQMALKDNKVIDLPNKENREVTLYEIKNMDKFSNSINEIMEEYKLEEINENEINDIRKEEENDLKEEYSCNQNKINKELNNKISKTKKFETKLIDDKKDNILKVVNDKDFISANAKKYLKTIEDYRNEVIKEYEKNNDNNIIKPLKDKKAIKIFNGDENIFLFQSKENGKLINFATLIGEKDKKTILLFKMKCYGEKSSLDNKFLNKIYIKNKLKRILINSVSLFNCKISKWYYYLIFYYNPKDSINQLRSELFKSYSSVIECLLYNPAENIFYLDYETKIDKIPLTKKADLDFNVNYLFNQKNYNYIYKMPTFDIKEIDYDNYLSEFIEKFQILKDNNDENERINLEQIMKKIKKIIKIEGKNIYYETALPMKKNYISFPSSLNIYIYKKKNSENFFAIINKENDSQKDIANTENNIIDSDFIYFDLEKKEKVDELLLDSNSNHFYCLSIENTKKKILSKKRRRTKSIDNN